MEAVEILAGEAGMQMPERDPQAQEKADRRTLLAEVMEQAVQFFRLQLRTGAAAEARAYLDRRGLSVEAQELWEIGFAPDAWQAMWDHLRGKSVDEELILGAGLAKPSQKGGKPYDTFRNRIIFPIRDARGRAIAFGGRAMDPGDNAKYLNSPETELFDKGRSLFNHGRAREAAGKGQPLVVAEGYMDVIALSEAGFNATVAPLGTAVTEHQLQMLWRVADEPIIALDGDTAGLRAAMRVIDLALPLLEAGKSLRFAIMPEGMDPDDLIRASGAAAMQDRLDQAQPMVRLLWQREIEGRVFDSPERKAALDKALREKIMLIRDPSLRSHYGQEINQLRRTLFAPPRTGWDGRKQRAAPAAALPGTRASLLATSDGSVETQLREAVILSILVTSPALLGEFESKLEQMACSQPDTTALRDLLLRQSPGVARETLHDTIAQALGPDALENLLNRRHVAVVPCLRKPDDTELARMTLTEEFAKLHAQSGLHAELSEAAEDVGDLQDEALTWRLSQAADAKNRAMRSQFEDTAEYETGENGARINREEREAFESLLDRITYSKRQH